MLGIVITLVAVGFVLWLINKYGAQFLDATIVKIINVVVVVLVILWLVGIFFPGLWSSVNTVPVPQYRGR